MLSFEVHVHTDSPAAAHKAATTSSSTKPGGKDTKSSCSSFNISLSVHFKVRCI